MIRIDPEKGNNKGTAQHELNQDIYSEMSSQMFNICEQLSGKWSNDVDKKSENVVRDLEEYLKKHERYYILQYQIIYLDYMEMIYLRSLVMKK